MNHICMYLTKYNIQYLFPPNIESYICFKEILADSNYLRPPQKFSGGARTNLWGAMAPLDPTWLHNLHVDYI